MDVRDFIENTLVQIVEGTNNAKGRIKKTGAIISSKNVRPLLKEGTTYNNKTGNLVNLVEFDIAITVNEKDTKEGMGGIKVAGIGIGGEISNERSNHTLSRIKFSVPLTFPSE